ncbi:MAG: hypothetical protein WD969_15515 [Paracoccaceae bacterium]
MSPTLRIGAVGFGLIAVCYGFARLAFGALAVVASLLVVAVARTLPAARGDGGGLPPLSGPVFRLIGATFLMGAASTALWSFGGLLVATRLGWGGTGAAVTVFALIALLPGVFSARSLAAPAAV